MTRSKYGMTLIALATLVSTQKSMALNDGFDFCQSDSVNGGGSGEFQQHIQEDAIVDVGEIPVGVEGVSIKLTSSNDVDIQLYDAEDGLAIVKWAYFLTQGGILKGPYRQHTDYEGVDVEWSGYNGDGTGLGNEYITLTGKTNRSLVMKVFGYREGYATVHYSWTGGQAEGCDIPESGGDSFQQQILKNAITTVGDIPIGVHNLYVRLNSNRDIDIQLYDKDNGTKIIVWPDGILNAATLQSVDYEGMTIEWSGFNGDGTGWGHEYIKISGETTRNLTMKVYGYQPGHAVVDYSWGVDNSLISDDEITTD
jgi:hypothetical protein